MLDNPFPVLSLCKLNHISQISTKITCKQLIPFRESYVFFEVIPGVLGRSVNFNITQRFLLRRPVFPDYPLLVTMFLQTWVRVCQLDNYRLAFASWARNWYQSPPREIPNCDSPHMKESPRCPYEKTDSPLALKNDPPFSWREKIPCTAFPLISVGTQIRAAPPSYKRLLPNFAKLPHFHRNRPLFNSN